MIRHRESPAAFGDADAELIEVLATLEEAENYQSWLLSLIGPRLRGHIMEVGAGRGTFSTSLRSLGSGLTAIEPSSRACMNLRSRLEGMSNVTVVEGTLADVALDGGFDSAVMVNVLEHIEDDVEALQQILQGLAHGGVLCVWVPAFTALYGNFDRRIGHYRRYRRRALMDRAQQAGFDIVDCRYTNLPGFFAWFLVVRMFGSSPTAGGLSKVYDRLFVPLTRFVERRVRPPFGQSLLLVARKPMD